MGLLRHALCSLRYAAMKDYKFNGIQSINKGHRHIYNLSSEVIDGGRQQ